MSKPSERAKAIDLSDLATPMANAGATPGTNQIEAAEGEGHGVSTESSAPRTAIGAISRSLAHNRDMERELAEARKRLATFEEGKQVVLLDPQQIRPGRYANRVPQSFRTQAFNDLKSEIAAAGRNVQPIKVRLIKDEERLAGASHQYEVIYGHRRHLGCLELGIPVASIIDDLGDAEAFIEMERENRGRADLSPFEQGLMYKRALDSGLFGSMRLMAVALNVAVSTVTTAVQLASLPQKVIDAFETPLDLQVRWSPALHQALKSDPERVLSTAEDIAKRPSRPRAVAIFEELVGLAKPVRREETSVQLKSGDKVVGYFDKDPKGAISVLFKPGTLTPAKERKLIEFLQKLA